MIIEQLPRRKTVNGRFGDKFRPGEARPTENPDDSAVRIILGFQSECGTIEGAVSSLLHARFPGKELNAGSVGQHSSLRYRSKARGTSAASTTSGDERRIRRIVVVNCRVIKRAVNRGPAPVRRSSSGYGNRGAEPSSDVDPAGRNQRRIGRRITVSADRYPMGVQWS